MKQIYHIAILLGLMLTLMVVPTSAAPMEYEPTENTIAGIDDTGINIKVSDKDIHVTGAAGLTMHIHNLTGARCAKYQIEYDDQTISTSLDKGIYVIKITSKKGKFVRKITI